MQHQSVPALSNYLITEDILGLLNGNDSVCWQFVNALPVAVYTTDAMGRLTHFNEAAVALWGRRPLLGDESWCRSWKLFHVDGAPLAHPDCPMALCLRENRPIRGSEAMALRPDGSKVIFEPYPTPIHDKNGRLAGAVNVLVDITSRKAAEERQQLLLEELNHRVKNTLATVMAISTQTFRTTGSPEAFRRAFEGRLLALSQTHDLLTLSCWTGVSLREILEQELSPHVSPDSDRVLLAGDNVRLGPVVAVTLGMAFHELVTNAAKYGALSVARGRVHVVWRLAELDQLQLDWQEMDGPQVRPPHRRGFGSRLIEEMLPDALCAKVRVEYPTAGVRCSMNMPLEQLSLH